MMSVLVAYFDDVEKAFDDRLNESECGTKQLVAIARRLGVTVPDRQSKALTLSMIRRAVVAHRASPTHSHLIGINSHAMDIDQQQPTSAQARDVGDSSDDASSDVDALPPGRPADAFDASACVR